MAKGKHAAALFEVIHSGKQLSAKEKTGLLRTPKWWFKGRSKPGDPTARPMKSFPPAASISPTDAIVVDPTDPVAPESHAPAPQVAGIDMKLDPDMQQITFKVSYTSAIVTTFALMVLVGLAYVIGKHMSRGPSPALAGPSTEQVRQGPANPDVLNVNANKPTGAVRQPEVREADDAISSNGQVAQNLPKTVTPTSAPPQAPATPGKRTVNLNYVVIQSYPDEAGAREAAKILTESGVGCTIEKGLRGWPGWFSVVGTDGFSRISAPEYTEYLKRIDAISDKFANRKSFKAFKPTAYKWDRP